MSLNPFSQMFPIFLYRDSGEIKTLTGIVKCANVQPIYWMYINVVKIGQCPLPETALAMSPIRP
jgi:hypothetical protein